MTKGKMDDGGFEKDSFVTVQRQGVKLERLSTFQGNPISRRFYGWNRTTDYIDGYFNPVAGWGNAGETVAFLARKARRAGITIRWVFIWRSSTWPIVLSSPPLPFLILV